MVAEQLVPDNVPTLVVYWLPRLLPVFSPPRNNLHRHIDFSVGLGIASTLLSTQSCQPDPSVSRLSLYFATVKTSILCFIIVAERPETRRQVFLLPGVIHSAPKDIQPYPLSVLLLP
jgi:hypothetical protein